MQKIYLTSIEDFIKGLKELTNCEIRLLLYYLLGYQLQQTNWQDQGSERGQLNETYLNSLDHSNAFIPTSFHFVICYLIKLFLPPKKKKKDNLPNQIFIKSDHFLYENDTTPQH